MGLLSKTKSKDASHQNAQRPGGSRQPRLTPQQQAPPAPSSGFAAFNQQLNSRQFQTKQTQQRPANGYANENPQIPGPRPRVQIGLDPTARATKSPFFAAFLTSYDNVQNGRA